MAKKHNWLNVQSLHEQGLEDAHAWWRDATERDKLVVWARIQAMGGPDDPLSEIVSRFAQLGFESIALKDQEVSDD